MIAILNSLPVKGGADARIVERFAESRGHVHGFPGFVPMGVLKSDSEDEVLVVMRGRDRESFDISGTASFRPRACAALAHG